MEVLEIVEGILFILYCIVGTRSVKYIKTNMMGVTAEFTNNLIDYFVKQLIVGVLLGWIAIPVALIHRHIISKH